MPQLPQVCSCSWHVHHESQRVRCASQSCIHKRMIHLFLRLGKLGHQLASLLPDAARVLCGCAALKRVEALLSVIGFDARQPEQATVRSAIDLKGKPSVELAAWLKGQAGDIYLEGHQQMVDVRLRHRQMCLGALVLIGNAVACCSCGGRHR